MARAYRQYSDQDAATEMEDHMQFVAEGIGGDWKKLARELKIKNRVIDNIDKDVKEGMEEKAIQVLLKWSRSHSQTIATIEILIKALLGIGETSIAEELGKKIGCQPKVEPMCKHNLPCPISESLLHQTSNRVTITPAEARAVPSESPIKIFDTELKKMFKNCTDNLNNCDCSTLVQKDYKMVQHVQKLNTVLQKLTEKYGDDVDEIELKEIEKSCRRRGEQAEQTMRLILQISADPGMDNKVPLHPKKGKTNKTRPASEILPRCTSEVRLQRRSNTISSTPNKSDISSPISTSKPNTLLQIESKPLQPKHDRIHEEQSRETGQEDVSTKVHQSIVRCESCGGPCMSTLQAPNPGSAGSASEHEQESWHEKRNQDLTMQPGPKDPEEEPEDYILV